MLADEPEVGDLAFQRIQLLAEVGRSTLRRVEPGLQRLRAVGDRRRSF